MVDLTEYADRIIRVTLSGKMLNGNEEWQTGFYVGKAQGAPDELQQSWVDGVRAAWQTFFTAGSGISNAYSFTECKAVLLEKSGRYVNPTGALVSYPSSTVVGPETGAPMPPQVALVATLVAGSGKGLAGKGRMYIPGVKWAISNAGTIDLGAQTSIGTKLTDFINAVNARTDRPGVVINASRGHQKQLGLGARNVPVNGVRIGNVYDTQRRRRNAISETYWTSPQIPAPTTF